MSFTLRSTGEIPPPVPGSHWRYHGRADAALRHCRPRLRRRQLVERGGHNPLEPAARHSGADGPAYLQLQRYLRQAAAGRWPDHRYRCRFAGQEVSTLLTDEDYRLWYGVTRWKCCTRTGRAVASATVTATLSAAAESLMSNRLSVVMIAKTPPTCCRIVWAPLAGRMKLSSSTPAAPTTPLSWPAASAPSLYPYRLARLWHSAPARAGLRHRRLGVDDRYR